LKMKQIRVKIPQKGVVTTDLEKKKEEKPMKFLKNQIEREHLVRTKKRRGPWDEEEDGGGLLRNPFSQKKKKV